jgi:plastocyanin
MIDNHSPHLLAIVAAATIVACGGGDARQEPQPTPAAAPAAAGGPIAPDPGGKVVTVEMETQPDGSNVYEPSRVEVRRGDVIRYMLVTGVHNSNFVPDSNPGKHGLPTATPLLQLPGQTYDVKVTLEPGTYYFHCDPHALLGMKGTVTVLP